VITDDQLALFDVSDVHDASESNGHLAVDADLIEAVRTLVSEPGMSDEEIQAVVADALAEIGWSSESPLRAQPCCCMRQLVLPPGSTCHWCGHSPYVEVGPRYLEPIEWQGRRWSEIRDFGQFHCAHGHELTAENTRIRPDGTTQCRTCAREGQRRRRAEARA
jgi:hypothetical protein